VIPSLLAITLCVIILWRWRHNKDPLPAPARSAFNRTFRRNTLGQPQPANAYVSTTDGRLANANNELKLLVRYTDVLYWARSG